MSNKIKEYSINSLLELYNKKFSNNDFKQCEDISNIIILLISLTDVSNEYENNYIIHDDSYCCIFNLKLISKLFNYDELNKILEIFFEKQLLILYNLLYDKQYYFISIIENLKLLIKLIIKTNKTILGINFNDNFKDENDIKICYDSMLKILKLLNDKKDIFKTIYDKLISNKNEILLKILIELFKNKIDKIDKIVKIDDKKDEQKDELEITGGDNDEELISIIKILITDLDDNKIKEIIKKICDIYLKKENNCLDKIVLKEFKKNVIRNFKDEKGIVIKEKDIINKLCNKEFKLDTIINTFEIRNILRIKKIYIDNKPINLKFKSLGYYVEFKEDYFKQIDKIDCNIEVFIDNRTSKRYYLKDFLYISSDNYNFPIHYDNNDENIDYLFNLISSNNTDEKIKNIVKFITGKEDEEVFDKIECPINKEEKIDRKDEPYNFLKKFKTYFDNEECEYKYKIEILKKLSHEKYQPFIFFKKDDSNFTQINLKNFNNFEKGQNIKEKNTDDYKPIKEMLDFKKMDINYFEVYYYKKDDFLKIIDEIIYNKNELKNKKEFFLKNINLDNLDEEIYVLYQYYDDEFGIYYKYYKVLLKNILTLKSSSLTNFYFDDAIIPEYIITDPKEIKYIYMRVYNLLKDTPKINEKELTIDTPKINEKELTINRNYDRKMYKFLVDKTIKYLKSIKTEDKYIQYFQILETKKKFINLTKKSTYEELIFDDIKKYDDHKFELKGKGKFSIQDINSNKNNDEYIYKHKTTFPDLNPIDFLKSENDNISIELLKDLTIEIVEEMEEDKEVEEDKEDEDDYIEDEEEDNHIIGGNKNIIELEDVFKLYYNSDEIINNIYKLYFVLNIYGYYYRDNQDKFGLIENLIEIIKTDVFNDDIIETIKNITTLIYHNTNKIYESYIRYFDKTDTIIKNYCQTEELIFKYLNMNFIYDFYKKYEKKDIKVQVNINGTILKINKSIKDINYEIDEIFINGEGLFQQNFYKININPYDSEIDNFIHFIYEFTKNQASIILTNINDLNAFIVLQLLSNEDDIIKLLINDNTYMMKNINNHPYKLYMIENFDIKITLNDVQFKLYKELFEMDNQKSLLGILAKDYYYLNFDIYKKSKFKFYLNYEIIPFISHLRIDDKFERSIINYEAFKPMMIEELTDLSILSVEKKSIIFLINYGILLGSTLFSQINIKNFISLIYIYFIIKNNTKKYLELYNYKDDNPIISSYRDYIKSINYLSFLKTILSLMIVNLDLKMDLRNFINKVINFKENVFIKSPIKIDINFVQTLYNTKHFKTDEKFIQNYYLSFLLFYKNCLKGKINNDIIKIFHIFLIPSLRFFRNKINIRDIENEVLDIKAIEYLNLIKGIKGGEEQNVIKVDINKAKQELKENENVLLTTDLNNNTKEILNLLQVFNDFYIEFSKLDLNDLIESFRKIIEELFLIYSKTDSTDKIYIISNNLSDLFEDYKDLSKEDKQKLLKKIIGIRSKITYNLSNLKDIIIHFSYKDKSKENESRLNDLSKRLAKILEYITNIELSLNNETTGIKKFKGKSKEVDSLYLEFFPQEDDKVPLMTVIKEFIYYYEKKIEFFIKIINNSIKKYDELLKDINKYEEKVNNYFNDEEKADIKGKNEKVDELKTKIKRNLEKIKNIEEENDSNKKKQINNNTRKSDDDPKENSKLDKENIILEQTYTENTEKITNLKRETVGYETELESIRNNKKGGRIDDSDEIKNLLNKDDTPFKDKDDKINFEDRKNNIKKRFDNIKKDYRKLKVSTYIPNSVNKDIILDNFINDKGDTLFEQILNDYSKDVKEKNQNIAKANFFESVQNNNLDPLKELEITFIDKLIFAFIVLFLRYAGLYITYKFIDNKMVKSIKEAIIYYSLSYVAVLFIFIFIVNIDLFRLRIIFNYCNLHINSTGILSHMIIIIIIGYIIYLLIINLDNEPIPTYLSKNENIKLKKKLDILTMIVLLFLLIFVLII